MHDLSLKPVSELALTLWPWLGDPSIALFVIKIYCLAGGGKRLH